MTERAPIRQLVKAPWPAAVVEALNRYQEEGVFHPYTCGNCRCREVLKATPQGWVCPREGCGYTQSWALQVTVEGEEK